MSDGEHVDCTGKPRLWYHDPTGFSAGYFILRCAKCNEKKAMIEDVVEPYVCSACHFPEPDYHWRECGFTPCEMCDVCRKQRAEGLIP